MPEIQQLILDQLREISMEVKRIPQIIAQLEQVSQRSTRLEAHDEEQEHAISDIRNRIGEFTTGITVLSNNLLQLGRDVETIKQTLSPFNQFVSTVNATSIRVDKLEATALDKDRREKIDKTLTETDEWRPLIKSLEKALPEISEWRPLLRSLKWFLMIAGVIFAGVVVWAILWAIQNSGVLIK